MVIIDCEMTGIDPKKNSIISIGGVDIENPERRLYIECQAWDGAECDPEGLAVCGFTEEECFDKSKKTLSQAMQEVYEWIAPIHDKTLAGQNVQLDMLFLNDSFKRSGIDFKFKYRVLDIHTLAYVDHIKRGNPIPLKEDGTASLSLDAILKYVGVPEEPRPHNALTGAMVSAEAISRLLYNKKLLKEFAQHELPRNRLSFIQKLKAIFG